MAFKYRARAPEQWEKRSHLQNDFVGILSQDFKEYQVKKGDNYVRILPPTWDDPEHYGYDVFVHYGVGPDRIQVLCPAKMKGEPCPICDAQAKALRANDKELADELRANKRTVVWMVDLKDEDAGPQLWSMPPTLDVSITKLARDPRTGDTYVIDHPTEGYGVSFEKEGEMLKTKYVAVQIDRKPSAANPDFLEFIETQPIPNCFVWRTFDELEKLYKGTAGAGREAREETKPREETRAAPREETKPKAAEAELRTRGAAPPKDSEAESLRKDAEHLAGRGNGQSAPAEAAPASQAAAAGSASSRAEELRQRFGRR